MLVNRQNSSGFRMVGLVLGFSYLFSSVPFFSFRALLFPFLVGLGEGGRGRRGTPLLALSL